MVSEDGLIRFANPAIALLNAAVQELHGKEFLDFLQKPHIPVWADSEFLMMAEDVDDFVQRFDWSALNS